MLKYYSFIGNKVWYDVSSKTIDSLPYNGFLKNNTFSNGFFDGDPQFSQVAETPISIPNFFSNSFLSFSFKISTSISLS